MYDKANIRQLFDPLFGAPEDNKNVEFFKGKIPEQDQHKWEGHVFFFCIPKIGVDVHALDKFFCVKFSDGWLKPRLGHIWAKIHMKEVLRK